MEPYRHKYIGTGSDKLMPLNLFSLDGMITKEEWMELLDASNASSGTMVRNMQGGGSAADKAGAGKGPKFTLLGELMVP